MDFAQALDAVDAGRPTREVAAELVAAMTPEERLGCLDGDGPFWAGLAELGQLGYHLRCFPAARVPRLGIPGFTFSDGPRGVVVDRATAYPVSMARGASFDVDLEERIGDAIGVELRAVGATLYGGVCVNLLRHPAWGRAQETYGEDPHHVGEMGAALTRGVQRHAMATVKHFAANSIENARFQVDVEIDEVALHEVFLPHFRRIVDEGVACVMTAYNQVNGSWAGESRELLAEILHDEWGFEGFSISDWIFGVRDGAASVAAGLDVEMPYRMRRAGSVPEALADGSLTWEEVDACVVRTMATLLRFARTLEASAQGREVLNAPAHRALAAEAARRTAVLLKNDLVDGAPALPLDPATTGTVAVIGPLGDQANLGDHGSSEVWAVDVVTAAAGISARHGDVVVDDGSDLGRAADVAASADAVVLVVGCTAADEGEYLGSDGMAKLMELFPGPDDEDEVADFARFVASTPAVDIPADLKAKDPTGFAKGGDRTSLLLPAADVALIEAVAAQCPRTVVVIEAGSTVLTTEWDDRVPAVLQRFYAGVEGGTALAELLFGDAFPEGRLPFSVPVHEHDLPEFDPFAEHIVYDEWHGWWKLERDGAEVAHPFGWGLSYSSTALERSEVVLDGDRLVARATVRNTGGRDDRGLVLVLAQREGSERRRLVGFARAEVAAGATTEVEVPIDPRWLAERDVEAHAMVRRPGTWRFWVCQHLGEAPEPTALVLG
jgi:beta-glucosidase